MAVILEFRRDQDELDAHRQKDPTREDVAVLNWTLFEMPIRLSVDEVVLLDWGRPPIFRMADRPLRILRDLRPGQQDVIDLGRGVLRLRRDGDLVHIENPYTRREAEAPYQELLGAWEAFSSEVRQFLVQEFPRFLEHPQVGAWFRGEEEGSA